MLGVATRNVGTIKRAIKAYREGLKESTKSKSLVRWARGQGNLATAYLTIGELQQSPRLVKKAIRILKGMLKYFPQDARPVEYIMAQVNIGFGLVIMGEIQNDRKHLEDALMIFKKIEQEVSIPHHAAVLHMSIKRANASIQRLDANV